MVNILEWIKDSWFYAMCSVLTPVHVILAAIVTFGFYIWYDKTHSFVAQNLYGISGTVLIIVFTLFLFRFLIDFILIFKESYTLHYQMWENLGDKYIEKVQEKRDQILKGDSVERKHRTNKVHKRRTKNIGFSK